MFTFVVVNAAIVLCCLQQILVKSNLCLVSLAALATVVKVAILHRLVCVCHMTYMGLTILCIVSDDMMTWGLIGKLTALYCYLVAASINCVLIIVCSTALNLKSNSNNANVI